MLTAYQEMNGSPVLTPPKSEALSLQTGMRTSLRGTQASGAGESHAHDANVAEVSYGKPVRSISRNVSKVDGGVHGHEKASKRCASLQAIGSEMERRWSASRPVLTRYKV